MANLNRRMKAHQPMSLIHFEVRMASDISIAGMKLLLNPAMIEKICKIILNKTDKVPLGFGEKFVTLIKKNTAD